MAFMAPTDSHTLEASKRHESDLYTRPGWVDADVALLQVDQGKANGDRGILWVRGRIQGQLRVLGDILDTHAGKFLFVCLLAIATFSVGLKSMTFHSDVEMLWAEPTTPDASAPPEMLSTHQLVIQTGADPEVNLLHTHGLLEHLDTVQKAIKVTVTMFDVTWNLKDFCQSPAFPAFEPSYLEEIFIKLMPCAIATPLDCFWEGSKLLGPDYPVQIPFVPGNQINWTILNPSELLKQLKHKENDFDYPLLEDYFKRSGITTGYQEKPCLNPKDSECPTTAPNYNSSHPLDVGAELTSGCYGIAAKYMHWPEELIVGGVTKNRSGHIKDAKALQTVVQLMGEHEFYEYWSGEFKVNHIGWTKEKAAVVLRTWQKKFAEEVDRLSKTRAKASSSYLFATFSTANVNKILKEYCRTDLIKYGVVLAAAWIYVWVAHSGIATLGVLVLAGSTTAAMGVCSLIGLPMNILSTYVLPFITVGLAMRDLFIILSVHTKNLSPAELLLRTGPSIISATMINAGACTVAAIVPVPALRVYGLQFAIMVIFHGIALLIMFPSLLALQQRCRKANVPCFRPDIKSKPHIKNNNTEEEHGSNLLTPETICQKKKSMISWYITRYLKSVLFKPFTKVVLCLTYIVLIVFCVFNGLKVGINVKLSSFVPKNTQEYKYLEWHNKYFGFYNFYLVTTELEYPYNQPLLYEYHSSMKNVPNVLKDSNGGLNMNNFWLANFREFLLDLQQEFEYNRKSNCLNNEKWFSNATEKAVLAFKLLAQTGIVEFPVDKSQIFKKRLVRNGIIDPKAFYNYLSVWNSNDHMSYSSSQANLTPKPNQYFSSKMEYELKILKSQPIIYAQVPFYLKNLHDAGTMIKTLKQIKDISDNFAKNGLKNYPVGLIFAYFNQFLLFDRLLIAQFLLTLLCAVIVACILVQWTKLWCALFSTLTCMLLLCFINIGALTGTIGALHFIIINRNILLIFTGFLSSIGNRERRVSMSLEINSDPIIKGDLGLLICATVLATSQFEFIYDYFFAILLSVCGSIANSLVFFPLFLSLVGPKAELQPLEHDNRISTPPPPTPPPAPLRTTSSSFAKPSSRRNTTVKATREPSLTTITEESCNQSIIVEPQVTVEYSSPESSSSGPFTAKVTATANIKVELVTPVYRPKHTKCHRSAKCDRRKRQEKDKQQCRCCKEDSDSSDSNVEAETCTSS